MCVSCLWKNESNCMQFQPLFCATRRAVQDVLKKYEQNLKKGHILTVDFCLQKRTEDFCWTWPLKTNFPYLISRFKWVSLAQTASWGSEIWPWYFILWIHKMLMDHTKPMEKSVCHSGAFSTLCSCCSAIRQLWWVLGGRHGPYSK